MGVRAVQSSSCTHIIANGGLSGSKTQKFLNGQGGRGASRRAKVVKIECMLVGRVDSCMLMRGRGD
jgi:hypothetical protein